MVPASASTPTLISGSANLACSSITMMSVPSTISKPPPQAMPLTAAMSGLSRLRGWFRPPKPPTPQSSSDASPAAAAFRSQPGEKKRSPAPVTIATRSAGSSRKALNTAFRRRLAARSMALALGRSMVTSSTAPLRAVLMPLATPSVRVERSDIALSSLHETDQCIDRHRALTARAHDDRIQIELGELLEIGRSVARARQRRLRQRRSVAGRAAAVTGEQPRHAQAAERRLDPRGGEGRQQRYAVLEQLGQHAAGPEHQQLAELRVDGDAHQDLGDAVGDHLLDQHAWGELPQAACGAVGLGGAAHVEHHAADVGLV